MHTRCGSTSFSRAAFFAVCDGHAGHEAAQYLHDHLLGYVLEDTGADDDDDDDEGGSEEGGVGGAGSAAQPPATTGNGQHSPPPVAAAAR